MHTLLFYEPGHFHAALLLKSANPRVDGNVHVYATPGPDLDRFVALVEDFNSRGDAPTDWILHLHTEVSEAGDRDLLDRLIVERRGEIVVVAGRNEPKLAAMRRLHDAGFSVLADKPWIVESGALPHLHRITSAPPTVLDVMTGRHDVVNRLCHRIVSAQDVFGDFASGTDGNHPVEEANEPDLEFGSVHHLCKTVDGRSLIRPPWYYDVAVQGDGMVDIHSHLVDQAQWLVAARRPPAPSGDGDIYGDLDDDIVIDRAERWSTQVPLADFTESTGLEQFPAWLTDRVTSRSPKSRQEAEPVLDLACNGRIDYRLRGVSVRQETVWRVRAAAGGGDEHRFVARGTGCSVIVDDGPEVASRPQLRLVPTATATATDNAAGTAADGWPARLARQIEHWHDEFPGLSTDALDHGHRLIVPEASATPHEEMFTAVLDGFLDQVENGNWSSRAASTIRTRYTLLARAQQMATD